MKKKKMIQNIVTMVIVVVLLVGGYYFISNRTKDSDVDLPETKVEQLIARDMDIDYPATPRMVVQLYSEFSKCFYDKDYNEKQYNQLVEQYRKLLDQELLVNNPEEDHLTVLSEEINGYEDADRFILTFYETKNSEPKLYKMDGKEYAKMSITYSLREGQKSVLNTEEEFVLRKDSEGKWKILGWQLAKKKK